VIYDIRGFTAASRRLRTASLGEFATGAHRAVLEAFRDPPPGFAKNLGDGHLLVWEAPTPEAVRSVVASARRVSPAYAAYVASETLVAFAAIPRQ